MTRFFRGFVGAVLVAALFVVPVSAERGSWNGWHVHDGHTELNPDATGLTHAGLGFFHLIFPGYSASTPALWAYCTDATDKGLVGGTGGAKFAAGHCQNESYIIHLQANVSNTTAPAGWSSFQWTFGTTLTTVYYRLTPR